MQINFVNYNYLLCRTSCLPMINVFTSLDRFGLWWATFQNDANDLGKFTPIYLKLKKKNGANELISFYLFHFQIAIQLHITKDVDWRSWHIFKQQIDANNVHQQSARFSWPERATVSMSTCSNSPNGLVGQWKPQIGISWCFFVFLKQCTTYVNRTHTYYYN